MTNVGECINYSQISKNIQEFKKSSWIQEMLLGRNPHWVALNLIIPRAASSSGRAWQSPKKNPKLKPGLARPKHVNNGIFN